MMFKKTIHFPLFLIIIKDIENNSGCSISKLGKQCKISYSHLNRLIEEIEVMGLITTKNKKDECKRKCCLRLTEKGVQVALHFNNILQLLDIINPPRLHNGGKFPKKVL